MAKRRKKNLLIESDESDFSDIDFETPVPVLRKPLSDIAPWAPSDAVGWMAKMDGKFSVEEWNLYVRLLSDQRMVPVWTWLSELAFSSCSAQKWRISTISFLLEVRWAMQQPRKPGNLSAAQRRKYVEQVRFHSEQLMELLADTRYSKNCEHFGGRQTTEMDLENLPRDVARDLEPHEGFGDFERVVAYIVTDETVSKLPWTYPESSLFDYIANLVSWTYTISTTDYQSKGTGQFTNHLFASYVKAGARFPMPLLATTANVALQLSVDEQVDEDTVRKQVKRRVERKKRSEDDDDAIPF